MDDPRPMIQDALKKAMIEKDVLRRDVLRGLTSEFKQAEIDGQKTLAAEDVVAILQREIKKRRESMDEARKAGREDIADGVQGEIAIIEGFLPAQLSRDQIEALVREAIAQTGARGVKEVGKVMGVLAPKVKGLADGKLVNEMVRDLLSE